MQMHNCLVLDMKRDGRMPPLGKHEAHPAHFWWYTSWGGGHQMSDDFVPDIKVNGDYGIDSIEGQVGRYYCLGRDADAEV